MARSLAAIGKFTLSIRGGLVWTAWMMAFRMCPPGAFFSRLVPPPPSLPPPLPPSLPLPRPVFEVESGWFAVPSGAALLTFFGLDGHSSQRWLWSGIWHCGGASVAPSFPNPLSSSPRTSGAPFWPVFAAFLGFLGHSDHRWSWCGIMHFPSGSRRRFVPSTGFVWSPLAVDLDSMGGALPPPRWPKSVKEDITRSIFG